MFSTHSVSPSLILRFPTRMELFWWSLLEATLSRKVPDTPRALSLKWLMKEGPKLRSGAKPIAGSPTNEAPSRSTS